MKLYTRWESTKEAIVVGRVLTMTLWVKDGTPFKVEFNQWKTDAEYSPRSFLEDYQADIRDFREMVEKYIN